MESPSLEKIFLEKFSTPPTVIAEAPGRINLLGEHTDYNEGYVLPGAIDKKVFVALAKNRGSCSRIYSVELGKECTFSVDQLVASPPPWTLYIKGVINEMKSHGVKIENFDAVIGSTLPLGAGMSSSSALQCGFLLGLNHLFGGSMTRIQMVLAAQKADHEFVGVRGGIMDQFTSLFAKKGCLIHLDCRNLEYSYHPLDLGEHELVLFNSGVQHQHLTSQYNVRRNECEQGVRILSSRKPDIGALRDASLADLESAKLEMDETVLRRCRYVIEENMRVQKMVSHLDSRNIAEIGKLLYETHHKLRHDYQVSCRELDILVESTASEPKVMGARMMGGGFGGCTLNLISTPIEDVVDRVTQAYRKETGIDAVIYRVELSQGAHLRHNQVGNGNVR